MACGNSSYVSGRARVVQRLRFSSFSEPAGESESAADPDDAATGSETEEECRWLGSVAELRVDASGKDEGLACAELTQVEGTVELDRAAIGGHADVKTILKRLAGVEPIRVVEGRVQAAEETVV